MCARSETGFAAAHHVLADAALADVDAEFEQFAVDAGGTTESLSLEVEYCPPPSL